MHRLEDNIRMELKEIGNNTRNCADSAQDKDYWSPFECSIETSSSIIHAVVRR
jgi:hypothetical protein